MDTTVETSVLKIAPTWGDPVENPQLASTAGNPEAGDNPFYGYYGYTRYKGNTPHSGFDYKTKEPPTEKKTNKEEKGEPTLSVINAGKVIRVRFGHPTGECTQRNNIKNNFFPADVCANCTLSEGCYGVHVWLEADKGNDGKYYCVYAHLSELSEPIFKNIPEIINDNTVNFKKPLVVKKGDIIGYSGRTGIAYISKYPAHLHFECRTGKETGSQISPNNAVNTQFTIMEIPNKDLLIGKNIWEPNDMVSQAEWKRFFQKMDYNIVRKEQLEIVGTPRSTFSLISY